MCQPCIPDSHSPGWASLDRHWSRSGDSQRIWVLILSPDIRRYEVVGRIPDPRRTPSSGSPDLWWFLPFCHSCCVSLFCGARSQRAASRLISTLGRLFHPRHSVTQNRPPAFTARANLLTPRFQIFSVQARSEPSAFQPRRAVSAGVSRETNLRFRCRKSVAPEPFFHPPRRSVGFVPPAPFIGGKNPPKKPSRGAQLPV